MAITSVRGTVSRVFFDGKGAEVTESWEARGETRSKRWSAFFDQPHGLSESDAVEVSGMHGDKVDSWEKDGEKQYTVKRTLNRARVVAGAGQQGGQEPPADPWPTVEPSGPAIDAYTGGEVPW